MTTDPRIDAYIEKQADFARPVLTWLRERMHAACPEVGETIKWGMPSFTYKDRPLSGMAAFHRHATFGFWYRHELGTGKEGEAMGQYGRIESIADLPSAEEMEALTKKAMALIDSGVKPQRAEKTDKPEADVPPELVEALADDELAAATFNAFPPSCRREYCEWIAEAKRPETKVKRVAEAVSWMREGKRRHWKYESC